MVPGFPINRTAGLGMLVVSLPLYFWLRRYRHEDKIAIYRLIRFFLVLFAVMFALLAIVTLLEGFPANFPDARVVG